MKHVTKLVYSQIEITYTLIFNFSLVVVGGGGFQSVAYWEILKNKYTTTSTENK